MWEEINFYSQKVSILGPTLFNIFLSELFLILQNAGIASYAGNINIYDVGKDI